MLESFRLRVFREVARQRNFRRAAEALYITQPAVTQHIKALESELKTALFDRGPGGVLLTAAGELLMRVAVAGEQQLSEVAEDIAALRGEVSGHLRIAASTTIAQYVLPGVIGEFLRQHPTVELSLESANTATVAQKVLDGEVALGLTEGPSHRAQLLETPWLEDELVLVVAPSHPWANQSVRASELIEQTLLLREGGSGTREVLEDALATANVPVRKARIRMELSSTEALLGCIEAGLGVGFASRFAIRRQLQLGTLAVAKVSGFKARRSLSIVQLRTLELRGPAAAFLDSLKMFAHPLRRGARRKKA